MNAPGLYAVESDASPVRGAPTDTGTSFVVVETERGPLEPRLCRSMKDVVRVFGEEQDYSFLHADAETFFRDKGGDYWVSRAVADAAATATLVDAKLVTSAKSPGAWGNGLQRQYIAGQEVDTFRVSIQDLDDVELEQSYDLADYTAAILWSQEYSELVTITAGVTPGTPVPAAAEALAGGTDSRNTFANQDWFDAIDRVTADLGPGQISVPGIGISAVHVHVADTLIPNNRTAILDCVAGCSYAAFIAAIQALQVSEGARRCEIYAQRAELRPKSGFNGRRYAPISAVERALTSQYDATGRLGDPVANIYGRSRAAIGLDREWTETEREAINAAGGSVYRVIRGTVTSYSDRSAAKAQRPDVDYEFSDARTIMWLRANILAVLEDYVLRKVTPSLLAECNGAIVSILGRAYREEALFGATAQDAYSSTVSFDPDTKTLAAYAEVANSPTGEVVVLDLARRPPTMAAIAA